MPGRIIQNLKNDLEFLQTSETLLRTLPNISFDNAILEKVSDLRKTLYCGITDPIPAELLAPEEIKGDETENFAS